MSNPRRVLRFFADSAAFHVWQVPTERQVEMPMVLLDNGPLIERVESLAIADLDFGPTEVTFVMSGNRAQTSLTDRGGNIGNSLLKDCALTVDHHNQRLFVSRPGP